MIGPIKFMFYRAARDYADYRIIQAEKAQAAAQSELCELAGTLADTRAELWDVRRLYEDAMNPKSPEVVASVGHIPTLNMAEATGSG